MLQQMLPRYTLVSAPHSDPPCRSSPGSTFTVAQIERRSALDCYRSALSLHFGALPRACCSNDEELPYERSLLPYTGTYCC